MADYRSMFDREYVGAWDLEGRDVVVTIDRVTAGELVSEGNKKTKKPILHLRGKDKKIALNKTNSKIIASLYGTETTKWVGKQITIYPTTTKFGRDTMDCIRVRPVVPGGRAQEEPGANG